MTSMAARCSPPLTSLFVLVAEIAESLSDDQWEALRAKIGQLSLDLRGAAAEPEIQQLATNVKVARWLDDLLDQIAERRALRGRSRP